MLHWTGYHCKLSKLAVIIDLAGGHGGNGTQILVWWGNLKKPNQCWRLFTGDTTGRVYQSVIHLALGVVLSGRPGIN